MRKMLILIFLLFNLGQTLLAYQVIFEGVESKEIREVISSISKLDTEQDRAPPTFFTLKKRAEGDKKNIIKALHAFGFYEGEIHLLYHGEFPQVTVRVQIFLGDQYFFNGLNVIDDQGVPFMIRESPLALEMGLPARSDVILDTEEEIVDQLAACGYPMASILNREVVVDQACKGVSVNYIIQPGPLAYFGNLSLLGLRKVRPGYIERRIVWDKGELFNPEPLALTESYLQESGLFTYVVVRPADELEPDGSLPILIQVEEKRFRHIGLGVSYSTDESFGGVAQWGHDNFTGWGDAFSAVAEYSGVVKRATLFYGLPDFWRRNQDLLFSTEIRREDTPGFIEREASFLVRLSRKVTDLFSYNFGARFEKLLSTKSDHDANFNLLSAPFQARWDTSNRLLNPTSGTVIAYFGTPYQALFNSSIFFYRQEAFLTTYHPIVSSGRFVFAFSAQLGSIAFQPLFGVPAPKRFYAGSSTTLRGYKYLTVSPLEGKRPIGGRSIMVYSVEARIRFLWECLYLAAFFDTGNVYKNPFPHLNEKVLNSTGFGIRYFTPLGPFRVDIAFPLNRRKGIDRSFQIYASVGQTF